MKKVILSLVAVLVSGSALAATPAVPACQKEALAVAKANLDQKALSYGFSGSDIMVDTVSLVPTKIKDTTTFTVEGGIYKGNYTVKVRMDSLCGVELVWIRENLSR
jgi:opacity protein-like surface antigen